jgi:hypothetical protein
MCFSRAEESSGPDEGVTPSRQEKIEKPETGGAGELLLKDFILGLCGVLSIGSGAGSTSLCDSEIASPPGWIKSPFAGGAGPDLRRVLVSLLLRNGNGGAHALS